MPDDPFKALTAGMLAGLAGEASDDDTDARDPDGDRIGADDFLFPPDVGGADEGADGGAGAELSDADLATFAAHKDGDTWTTGDRIYTRSGGKTTWKSAKRKAAPAKKAPAAKRPEPAKGAPAKKGPPRKPDARAAADEVRARLNGDASKLTPKAVMALAEALSGMTVADIKAIKAEHDLKGGRTKTEHIAKLLVRAKELKKAADAERRKANRAAKKSPADPPADPPVGPKPPAEEPPGSAAPPVPPPAAAVDDGPGARPDLPVAHPVRVKLAHALDVASRLTDDQRGRFAAAVGRVTGAMPRAALDRIDRHLDGAVFYPDPKEIGPALLRAIVDQPGLTDADRARKAADYAYLKALNVGGAYIRPLRAIHVDGDHEHKNPQPGRHAVGAAMLAHGVYAHELGHVLDGPDHEVSGSSEWAEAFGAEIDHSTADADAGKTPRLSYYGGSTPSEGFAEFCRIVYGSDVPHAQIASEFPKATAVFKARGWWPEVERAGAAGTMAEVFDKRVDVGTDGSHVDTLKHRGRSRQSVTTGGAS